jgi:hypothetical protein
MRSNTHLRKRPRVLECSSPLPLFVRLSREIQSGRGLAALQDAGATSELGC